MEANQKTKKELIPHNKKLSTNSSAKQIITAPIVTHSFFNKKGVVIEKEQIYLQLSVQYYYVKFCKSVVNKTEFEVYLMKNYSKTKAIILEFALKDGAWKNCNTTENAESRKGPYVIIHRIIHTKKYV